MILGEGGQRVWGSAQGDEWTQVLELKVVSAPSSYHHIRLFSCPREGDSSGPSLLTLPALPILVLVRWLCVAGLSGSRGHGH